MYKSGDIDGYNNFGFGLQGASSHPIIAGLEKAIVSRDEKKVETLVHDARNANPIGASEIARVIKLAMDSDLKIKESLTTLPGFDANARIGANGPTLMAAAAKSGDIQFSRHLWKCGGDPKTALVQLLPADLSPKMKDFLRGAEIVNTLYYFDRPENRNTDSAPPGVNRIYTDLDKALMDGDFEKAEGLLQQELKALQEKEDNRAVGEKSLKVPPMPLEKPEANQSKEKITERDLWFNARGRAGAKQGEILYPRKDDVLHAMLALRDPKIIKELGRAISFSGQSILHLALQENCHTALRNVLKRSAYYSLKTRQTAIQRDLNGRAVFREKTNQKIACRHFVAYEAKHTISEGKFDLTQLDTIRKITNTIPFETEEDYKSILARSPKVDIVPHEYSAQNIQHTFEDMRDNNIQVLTRIVTSTPDDRAGHAMRVMFSIKKNAEGKESFSIRFRDPNVDRYKIARARDLKEIEVDAIHKFGQFDISSFFLRNETTGDEYYGSVNASMIFTVPADFKWDKDTTPLPDRVLNRRYGPMDSNTIYLIIRRGFDSELRREETQREILEYMKGLNHQERIELLSMVKRQSRHFAVESFCELAGRMDLPKPELLELVGAMKHTSAADGFYKGLLRLLESQKITIQDIVDQFTSAAFPDFDGRFKIYADCLKQAGLSKEDRVSLLTAGNSNGTPFLAWLFTQLFMDKTAQIISDALGDLEISGNQHLCRRIAAALTAMDDHGIPIVLRAMLQNGYVEEYAGILNEWLSTEEKVKLLTEKDEGTNLPKVLPLKQTYRYAALNYAEAARLLNIEGHPEVQEALAKMGKPHRTL